MKTFKQCCDEVAKKRGYVNYHDWFIKSNDSIKDLCEEAAELYTQQAINEKDKEIDKWVTRFNGMKAAYDISTREKVIESIKLARKIIVPENGSLDIMYTEEEILKQLGL